MFYKNNIISIIHITDCNFFTKSNFCNKTKITMLIKWIEVKVTTIGLRNALRSLPNPVK